MGLLALMVSPFYLHLMSYLNFMTDALPLPHPENKGTGLKLLDKVSP